LFCASFFRLKRCFCATGRKLVHNAEFLVHKIQLVGQGRHIKPCH
jgi:hypothetical protein